jgi:hypothetical protein
MLVVRSTSIVPSTIASSKPEPTTKERGLLYEIGRQRNMKLDAEKSEKHTQTALLHTLYELAKYDLSAVERLIWQWAIPHNHAVLVESHLLGVYTTLGTYTNKAGKSSPAHFSAWGKYIGSVKQLGPHPVSYTGYFRVNEDQFTIDLAGVAARTATFETMFIVRSRDETPLAGIRSTPRIELLEDDAEPFGPIVVHSGHASPPDSPCTPTLRVRRVRASPPPEDIDAAEPTICTPPSDEVPPPTGPTTLRVRRVKS